ncbi:hypothetical protein, partial [Aeromonas hydrophila]
MPPLPVQSGKGSPRQDDGKDQYGQQLTVLSADDGTKQLPYREFNFEVQFPIKNQAAFRSSSKTTC